MKMLPERGESRPGIARPLAAAMECLKQESLNLIVKITEPFIIPTDSRVWVVSPPLSREAGEEFPFGIPTRLA